MTGRSLDTSRVLVTFMWSGILPFGVVPFGVLFFGGAVAQVTTEQAEEELKHAVEALSNATSYHFAYSMTPNVEAPR